LLSRWKNRYMYIPFFEYIIWEIFLALVF
jgi:hypothetical protein